MESEHPDDRLQVIDYAAPGTQRSAKINSLISADNQESIPPPGRLFGLFLLLWFAALGILILALVITSGSHANSSSIPP